MARQWSIIFVRLIDHVKSTLALQPNLLSKRPWRIEQIPIWFLSVIVKHSKLIDGECNKNRFYSDFWNCSYRLVKFHFSLDKR